MFYPKSPVAEKSTEAFRNMVLSTGNNDFRIAGERQMDASMIKKVIFRNMFSILGQ